MQTDLGVWKPKYLQANFDVQPLLRCEEKRFLMFCPSCREISNPRARGRNTIRGAMQEVQPRYILDLIERMEEKIIFNK